MEDLAKEALVEGRFGNFMSCVLKRDEFAIAAEGAKFVLMEIVSTKHWLRASIVLCFACGLAEELDWTQPEMARRLGIRKQALNQAIKKVRVQLGLRKTRMMRSEVVKRRMSRSNFRHFKDLKDE